LTEFTFYADSGPGGNLRFSGFSVSGHTGSAPAGEDLICAAISKAAELVCNTITDVYGVGAGITADGASVSLTLSLPDEFSGGASADRADYRFINQYAVNGLLDGFYRWALALAGDSGGCVAVRLAEGKI